MTLATFTVETSRGPLRCAATDAGLALICLPGSDFDAQLAPLVKSHGPARAVKSHPAATQLAAYFAGRLKAFDLALDLSHVTEFTRGVLEELRAVPFGELTTYGALADRVGRPRAARAVGRAVGSNPLPVVVPCHRVVAAGGGLGGFSGGLPMKRWLLAHEGALEARPGTSAAPVGG